MYSVFPLSNSFFPNSFIASKLSNPSSSFTEIKSFILVFPLSFISFIVSDNLLSNTIAFASDLTKEFSNSPTCNSLSKGIETIPPKRLAKCATAHS